MRVHSISKDNIALPRQPWIYKWLYGKQVEPKRAKTPHQTIGHFTGSPTGQEGKPSPPWWRTKPGSGNQPTFLGRGHRLGS